MRKLEKKGAYVELPSDEYVNYVMDSTVNIIDVRTEKEYAKSHIPGAVNYSFVGGNFKKMLDSSSLDTAKTTLIYCETQHRSLFAAKKLYKAGFSDVIDLDKGMMRWRKDSLPTIYPEATEED